jgi:hypothetical protein
MDGNTIKLEAADAMVQVHGFKVFWTSAERRVESLLNSLGNIMPADELDAYERRRIETLVDALDRAEQIRRNFNI